MPGMDKIGRHAGDQDPNDEIHNLILQSSTDDEGPWLTVMSNFGVTCEQTSAALNAAIAVFAEAELDPVMVDHFAHAGDESDPAMLQLWEQAQKAATDAALAISPTPADPVKIIIYIE